MCRVLGDQHQWQKATADSTGDGNPDLMNWEIALAYAENLSLAGHNDWRLPNINELWSITDFSQATLAINTNFFPDTQSSLYHSSTTYVSNPARSWQVDFNFGSDNYPLKNTGYYVRSVRNGTCAVPKKSQILNLVLSAIVGRANNFNFTFPLKGYTPYNAPITSVFDHSQAYRFEDDNKVVSYTGEIGEIAYGKDWVWSTHYGFKNNTGVPFIINGNYTGGGDRYYLYYDGHPGYDFSVGGKNIDVFAVAPGTAFRGDLSVGEVYINHHNGYTTHYLHLLFDDNLIKDNTEVTTSTSLGLSGGTGGFPVHLHFEVKYNGTSVDPYGWEGDGADPYIKATNKKLW